MADTPDGIELGRHRDNPWTLRDSFARYGVLLAVGGLLALGLANVFGQRERSDLAVGPAAQLEVSAPTRVRGGLFFQGRFRIHATRLIRHATLVLDPGWQEQLSINTIEPSPIGEASRDGRLALDFGALHPGDTVVARIQFQVNPAQFFVRRSQDVELADGEERLLSVDRTLTVFP
jgi:hypothetical protein